MYKYSILIVDHEESIRLSLSEILRLEGYDVQVASRPEEAFNSLQRQSFDLMIVDLNLPGMGGMELLTRALELYPNLQGIILSTSATVENVIEALRLRVADYLLKPVSVADIRKSVNRAFRIDAANPKTLHESRRLYPTIPAPGNEYILSGQVTINIRKHIIQWDDESVVLTPTETRFLGALLEQANQVVPHSDIIFSMHGYRLSEEEAATVLRPIVSRLRKKLSAIPAGDLWIKTVRSSGYRFVGQVEPG